MKSVMDSVVLLALLGLASGCGSGKPAPAFNVPVSAPVDDDLPLVTHPEYANWSQFEKGIEVTRKKEVSNEIGTVHVTTRLRLTENTPEKVIVESQVTVDRPGHALQENPPMEAEYPASFRLPKSITLEVFDVPSKKAKLVGEEKISISGTDYVTSVYEWEEVNEAGPMTVKLWWSKSFPGRFVKQENFVIRTKESSTERVTQIQQTGASERL